MLLRERLRSRRGREVPTVHIRVRGGYEPSVLYGRVGEPLRIVFSREETASCSEHVVFPAFGKSAMLPPFEDVVLELVPEHAGEYEFTCQLGMLRGRLVVDGGAERSVSTTSAGASRTAGPWSGSIASEHGDKTTVTYAPSRGG
jgi:plastocyanin domain-containing protein